MSHLKRAFAGIITAAVAAVSLSVSHATLVHASCTGAGNWTDTASGNIQWGSVSGGLADYLWQEGEDLGYEEQADPNNPGFCEIQYRAAHFGVSDHPVRSKMITGFGVFDHRGSRAVGAAATGSGSSPVLTSS